MLLRRTSWGFTGWSTRRHCPQLQLGRWGFCPPSPQPPAPHAGPEAVTSGSVSEQRLPKPADSRVLWGHRALGGETAEAGADLTAQLGPPSLRPEQLGRPGSLAAPTPTPGLCLCPQVAPPGPADRQLVVFRRTHCLGQLPFESYGSLRALSLRPVTRLPSAPVGSKNPPAEAPVSRPPRCSGRLQ